MFDCMQTIETITHLFTEVLGMFNLGAFWSCLDMSGNTWRKWQSWFVASIDTSLYVKYQEYDSTLSRDIGNVLF